jgi:hypothetical protein
MADSAPPPAPAPQGPALPSTADATPYVPLAGLAVASVIVAGLLALALLLFGVPAFLNRKPLLEPWLLVLGAIGVALAFAARRVIRNSEGTRGGEQLASAAWWLAVVLGLCYAAYLMGIDFSIKREARRELDLWLGLMQKGTDEDLGIALWRTLPPGERQSLDPRDTPALRLKYRDPLLVLGTCDLAKLLKRNGGAVTFEHTGSTWGARPGAIDSGLSLTATCPEGRFPLVVLMKGLDGAPGPDGGRAGPRQWLVSRPQGGGFVDQSRAARTPYGWFVEYLERDGGAFGRGFVSFAANGPAAHPYAYRAFVAADDGDRKSWRDLGQPISGRLQIAFALATGARGDDWAAGYAAFRDTQLIKKPDGTDHAPAARASFLAVWNTMGLRPPGDRLREQGGGPVDKEDVLALTDGEVVVRVPAEIPFGARDAARARVVVSCTDPAVLAELKQLRATADPKSATTDPPAALLSRTIPWRVVRVESDLSPVTVAPPQRMPGEPNG